MRQSDTRTERNRSCQYSTTPSPLAPQAPAPPPAKPNSPSRKSSSSRRILLPLRMRESPVGHDRRRHDEMGQGRQFVIRARRRHHAVVQERRNRIPPAVGADALLIFSARAQGREVGQPPGWTWRGGSVPRRPQQNSQSAWPVMLVPICGMVMTGCVVTRTSSSNSWSGMGAAFVGSHGKAEAADTERSCRRRVGRDMTIEEC